MYEENNFLQWQAQIYAEAYNNKIAEAIITEIDNLIWLESIIEADNATRKKAFDETYEAWTDELKDMLVYEPIKFVTTTDKLQYAFWALLEKGYTFTHTVDNNWVVSLKFFTLHNEIKFELTWTYKVSIDKIED